MKKHCIRCGKIIMENFLKFMYEEIDKGRKIIEIECPYCKNIETLK